MYKTRLEAAKASFFRSTVASCQVQLPLSLGDQPVKEKDKETLSAMRSGVQKISSMLRSPLALVVATLLVLCLGKGVEARGLFSSTTTYDRTDVESNKAHWENFRNNKILTDVQEDVDFSGSGVGIDLNRNLKVAPGNGTALDRYMAMPDPEYAWNYTGNKKTGIIPGVAGWTSYSVILTSQRWLTEAEAAECSLWQHEMLIFIPDNLDKNLDTAGIWITEGLDPPTNNADHTQEILLCSAMAVGTQTVIVSLFQVPNQFCTFPDDPKHLKREEDKVIAYTWRKFIDLKRANDSRADMWPLRLPMTKAAVRGMDATEEFLSKCTFCSYGPLTINSWITMGASKRGWTTWMTGAEDKRVIGMAPIVMDCVNQHKLFHRWYQNMGGWSFAIGDYTNEDLMADLDSPEFQELLAIIDPYSYRDRLTMPKLVISATGDEFFQVMDDHYWFDDMPGKTLLLKAPNADHTEMTGIPVVLPSAISFSVTVMSEHKAKLDAAKNKAVTAGGPKHPAITWTHWYEGDADQNQVGHINVTVDLNGPVPESVWVRHAHTDPASGRLDFRWFNLDEDCKLPRMHVAGFDACPIMLVWFDDEIQPIEKTTNTWTYTASVKAPEKGWAGFYLEMRFPGVSELFFELPYTVTSQTFIVPDTVPFPDCSGAECEGKLV